MNNKKEPDIREAAVCGLFCPSCGVYIASHEDENRLKAIAARLNQTVEETRCNGCRSDKVSGHCDQCKFRECIESKNILFCSQCSEYPCNSLKEFQIQLPHRLELWESLENIKENGFEKWYAQMVEHYSCKKCGTMNSGYDLKCRSCGTYPGNGYVEKHIDEIKKRLGI